MIAAIVPAKSLDSAKERLAAVLSPAERHDLALAMLGDAVRALEATPGIGVITVVSPDAEVLQAAGRMGTTAVEEPGGSGLNGALEFALARFEPRPEALVILLADVPGISARGIVHAVERLDGERGVVIWPSGDGGTALLAQRPAGVIPFCFGRDSASAHREASAAAGIEPVELDPLTEALDIDSPDDLRAFLEQPGDSATRRYLRSIGMENRLAEGERIG